MAGNGDASAGDSGSWPPHVPLPLPSGRFVLYGTLAELSLVPVAWLLGWLTGLWDWNELSGDFRQFPSFLSLARGVVATLPMLIMLVVVLKASGEAFRRMRRFLQDGLLPHIRNSSLPALFCLSLAAGLGEEWLFRGMLQQGLLTWWDGLPVSVGILIVAVIFGVCHWITHLYFLLATLTGIYLGWLYQYSGSLVEPVLAHALYDFIALVVITRRDDEPGAEPFRTEDLEDRGKEEAEPGDDQPE